MELGKWVGHTLDVHVESTGEVWGEGYAEDPTTLDPTGAPTKWFSYSWENGVFDFVGADGTAQLRASFGPSDVEWSQDNEGNWIADIAEPGSGPQPLWPVVALAVAVAVALSGDGGCSCGHNGGTDNHPGTNHP